MKAWIWVAGALALAGCDATTLSQSLKAAADGFQRGYGDGPAPVQSQPAPQVPLLAQPSVVTPIGPQAFFTGKAEQVQTVTGTMAWQCQYQYAGQNFLVVQPTYCQSSIPVR